MFCYQGGLVWFFFPLFVVVVLCLVCGFVCGGLFDLFLTDLGWEEKNIKLEPEKLIYVFLNRTFWIATVNSNV